MTTYTLCSVWEGLAYTCVRIALQLVTEQGQGTYRMLQQQVPSSGVSYCVKYYVRLYHALVINLTV